jgi:hypothetical protein
MMDADMYIYIITGGIFGLAVMILAFYTWNNHQKFRHRGVYDGKNSLLVNIFGNMAGGFIIIGCFLGFMSFSRHTNLPEWALLAALLLASVGFVLAEICRRIADK